MGWKHTYLPVYCYGTHVAPTYKYISTLHFSSGPGRCFDLYFDHWDRHRTSGYMYVAYAHAPLIVRCSGLMQVHSVLVHGLGPMFLGYSCWVNLWREVGDSYTYTLDSWRRYRYRVVPGMMTSWSLFFVDISSSQPIGRSQVLL